MIILFILGAIVAGVIGWVFGFSSGLDNAGAFKESEQKEYKGDKKKYVTCNQLGCGLVVNRDVSSSKVREISLSSESEVFYCPTHRKPYEEAVFFGWRSAKFYKTFEVDESGKIVKPKHE